MLRISKISILSFSIVKPFSLISCTFKKERKVLFRNRAAKLRSHYTDLIFDFWSKNTNWNQLTLRCSPWRKAKKIIWLLQYTFYQECKPCFIFCFLLCNPSSMVPLLPSSRSKPILIKSTNFFCSFCFVYLCIYLFKIKFLFFVFVVP